MNIGRIIRKGDREAEERLLREAERILREASKKQPQHAPTASRPVQRPRQAPEHARP